MDQGARGRTPVAPDPLTDHPLFNQQLDHPGLEVPLYNVARQIGYNVS